jgi:hypothetical protein
MKPQAAAHLLLNRTHSSDPLAQLRNAALLDFLPAQLTCFQTAYLLGFQERDVKTLAHLGLLTPLGNPAQNAIKYYFASEILELASDRDWLSNARQAVYDNDAKQNARKKAAHSSREQPAIAA